MTAKRGACFIGACLGIFLPLAYAYGAPRAAEDASGIKPSSLIVLPIVFYMPETRWGGGAGGLYTFYPGEYRQGNRPCSLLFDAYYTQNRQYALELKPEIYLRGNTIFLDGLLSFDEFPNTYFGLGNDSSEDDGESYTPRSVTVEASAQRKVRPGGSLYIGLQARFEHMTMRRMEEGGALASGLVPGSRGANLTGLGFNLKWDNRDNVFFPRSGVQALATAMLFGRALGGEFDYSIFKMDLRVYQPVLAAHVLALQVILEALAGTAPFTRIPKLGGDSVMRGYYSGRYRDKVLLAVQAEYRLPLWGRFGLTAFGGLGRVACRLSRLCLRGVRYSAGCGLRFAVNREEKTNLRLDYGFGEGTAGLYFTVKEAF